MLIERRTAKRKSYGIVADEEHPRFVARTIGMSKDPAKRSWSMYLKAGWQTTLQENDNVIITLSPAEVRSLIQSTTMGMIQDSLTADEFAEWMRLNKKVFGAKA